MYPLWEVILLLPLYFVSVNMEDTGSQIWYVKDRTLTKGLVNEYAKDTDEMLAWVTFERFLYVLECYDATKTALLARYYGVIQNGYVTLTYMFSLEVVKCNNDILKYIKILRYNASTYEERGLISSQSSCNEYTLTSSSRDFPICGSSRWVEAKLNTWDQLTTTDQKELSLAIHAKWKQLVCQEPEEGSVIETITTGGKSNSSLQGYWITYQGALYRLECYMITRNTSEAYLSRISTSFDSSGELKEFDIILKLRVKNCQSDILRSIKVITYETTIGIHRGIFIDKNKCCWRYDKPFDKNETNAQYCAYFEDNLWSITRKNYWKQISKQNQKQEIEKMYNHWRSCYQVKKQGKIIEIFKPYAALVAQEKRYYLVKSWMNFQKNNKPSMYILECYESQEKTYIVHMYSYVKNETTHEPKRTYILRVTVTECDSEMVDSIKVLPYTNGIHRGMCIDVYRCCNTYSKQSGDETVIAECTDYGSSNWINDMYSKWDVISVTDAERRFKENKYNEDLCTMENPGQVIEAYPPKQEEIKNDDQLITSTTLWTTVQGKVMYIIECSKKMDHGGHTFFALLGIYNGEKTEKGEPVVNYFLKMVVTFCNREVLNSMTVLPYDQHTGTHHGLYTDNKKCCTLYSKSVSETSLEFRPCTQYQKNTWKNIDWTGIQKDHIIEYYYSPTRVIPGLNLTIGIGKWLFQKIPKLPK